MLQRNIFFLLDISTHSLYSLEQDQKNMLVVPIQGERTCILKHHCHFCITVMTDQGSQLPTPTYKLKKGKSEKKEARPP